MKKIIIFLSLLFSLAVTITQETYAQSIIGCLGCEGDNEYQYQARVAFNKVNTNPRESAREVYQVVNLETGTVKSFDVGRSFDYETRRVRYRISPSQINYSLEYEAKDFIYFIKQQPQTVDVPTDLFDDVYDALDDPALDSKISNFLFFDFGLESFVTRASAYTFLPFAMFGRVVNANFTVEINLGDGSTLYFRVDGINSDGSISWEYMEAKDSKGQNIPENKDAVKGKKYAIPKGAGAPFISYLRGIGVSYSSSIPDGEVTIIDCTGTSCKGEEDGDDGDDGDDKGDDGTN